VANGVAEPRNGLIDRFLVWGMGILVLLGSWNLAQTYQNGRAISAIVERVQNQKERLDRVQGRFENHIDKEKARVGATVR